MTLLKSFSLLAACVFSAAVVTSSAHATTINGSLWENSTAYPDSLSSTPPSGTPSATFTVSDINFFSTDANYTILGFIASDPKANPVVTSAQSGIAATDTLNDTTWMFTGSTYLTAGTYYVNHDDGMYLFLNGDTSCTAATSICSGAPTSAEESSFTVAADGNYNYQLLYAEVNGAPAVLNAPFAATPEPSSLILLGSGLLGVAGAIRRRIKL